MVAIAPAEAGQRAREAPDAPAVRPRSRRFDLRPRAIWLAQIPRGAPGGTLAKDPTTSSRDPLLRRVVRKLAMSPGEQDEIGSRRHSGAGRLAYGKPARSCGGNGMILKPVDRSLPTWRPGAISRRRRGPDRECCEGTRATRDRGRQCGEAGPPGHRRLPHSRDAASPMAWIARYDRCSQRRPNPPSPGGPLLTGQVLRSDARRRQPDPSRCSGRYVVARPPTSVRSMGRARAAKRPDSGVTSPRRPRIGAGPNVVDLGPRGVDRRRPILSMRSRMRRGASLVPSVGAPRESKRAPASVEIAKEPTPGGARREILRVERMMMIGYAKVLDQWMRPGASRNVPGRDLTRPWVTRRRPACRRRSHG